LAHYIFNPQNRKTTVNAASQLQKNVVSVKLKREAFNASATAHRMLRLYVGLEEPGYIINDIEQAFNSVTW
jgi:cystathionine beta-lyase/cystathionine gamma-synthase